MCFTLRFGFDVGACAPSFMVKRNVSWISNKRKIEETKWMKETIDREMAMKVEWSSP